jgi:peptidoglycan/LPS O-acetylase OafA/YrhL
MPTGACTIRFKYRAENRFSKVPTQPAQLKPLAYRPEIDGLRAIAVLGVVFFHAGFGPPAGFVGVDVFFVISGYLMTLLLETEWTARGRIDP